MKRHYAESEGRLTTRARVHLKFVELAKRNISSIKRFLNRDSFLTPPPPHPDPLPRSGGEGENSLPPLGREKVGVRVGLSQIREFSIAQLNRDMRIRPHLCPRCL